MNAPVNDNDHNDHDGGFGDSIVDDASHLSPDEASDSDDESNAAAEPSTNCAAASPIGRGDDNHPQAQLLEDLQSQLYSLTLEAETVLSRQPRSTQLALVAETKSLFSDYKQYGSMARLKVGVEKFLRLGDEKGKVCIEEEEKEEGEDDSTNKGKRRLPSQSQSQPKRPAHYGEAFMLNYTEDDDKPKFDAKVAFPTTRNTDTPFPLSDPDDSDADFHPLRTVDPDSVPYVTTLPWDPIATKISWPDHRRWPKGLLGNVNKILSIADAEARERLFHHVSKYGPAPVFRVGIAEQLKSEYATIFETARDHYLGLSPETRTFLRGVYWRHKHLNPAERRMLALTCRVAEDSVQMFWEDMADSLRGYEAMRIFMAARELERADEAQRSQADKRRAEVLKIHVERFNREFRSTAPAADDVNANANANANASTNANPNSNPYPNLSLIPSAEDHGEVSRTDDRHNPRSSRR